MIHAAIALGTNLGDLEANIQEALRLLDGNAGKVLRASSCFKTEPWGFHSKNPFLNAVAVIGTELSPGRLLDVLQRIEWDMGRRQKSIDGQYHDRIMDLDILFYGDTVLETSRLRIPHPLMERRPFVLDPLFEVCPQWVHPVLKKTVAEIREDFLNSKPN